MGSLRGVWRMFGVVAQIVSGVIVAWHVFPRLTQAQRDARAQQWALVMLKRLGIALQVKGERPLHGPLLLVANHVSWLDIVVMHAAGHCRFISKSDVRDWPLVGVLADAAGTLYIERTSRRDAMRVVHLMAAGLQAGDVLAVFPEGTTGDGSGVLPFHGNLLQAAIAVHAPALPVALQFVDRLSGQRSFAPCYIGDDTLVQSLWRTLRAHNLQAVVQFGVSQHHEGRDRRVWAEDLREAIIAMRA
jgi:1-acyl-sn-glycerol-3-phosphate acyltransferase